jgi:bifunctional non-homologous end joining protein LigD
MVFADAGITKGEVADYYAAIADWLLPGVAERPLSLLRCPQGTKGECFFQKHHADALGTHVHAIPLKEKQGKDDYLFVKDATGLLELVQMNVLEFHPWGARVDKPERPDAMVFDLDPGPGIAWKQVAAAAREVRDRLRDAGLTSFVRLSGGKGVHVVVPIRRGPSWDEVKDFTGAFAEAMAAHKPLRYVATMSKAKRNDRIFIDWLRNGRGATSVCSWSLRARPGAPVAMPLRWEELGRVEGPAAFDLHKALARAKRLRRDPWKGYADCRQSLPKLV